MFHRLNVQINQMWKGSLKWSRNGVNLFIDTPHL